MIKDLLFLIIISVIGSLFNVAHFAYNSDIEFINILGTTIFLTSIILYSYYKGRKKDEGYRNSVIIYGLILFLSNMLDVITQFSLIAFPMITNMISMYPIIHLMGNIMGSSLVLILVFLLEIILMIIGYYFGKGKRLNIIKRG